MGRGPPRLNATSWRRAASLATGHARGTAGADHGSALTSEPNVRHPLARRIPALAILLAGAAPAAAQVPAPGRPQPSILWAAAAHRADLRDVGGARAITSRTDGLAVGAVLGGLVAGFLGHRACRAYGATGDCWGQALWWGAMGGMLGGLIGASAVEEEET